MTSRAILGRSSELAAIAAALDRALDGHGGIFLLTGEPGIGKTRLAEEISDTAERRGAAVHWGRAWEVEGAPACWPWTQLLRACAPDPGAELAPILSFGGAASAGTDPELELPRLAAAILALLRRLSGARPIVLVFDDLHAVDVATLTLLQLVARDLRGLRVLIAGTYREVEARRQPRISALLAKIAREGTALPLGRLGESAVGQWLEAVIGVAPTAELVAAVFGATEGNPLFVQAVAQLLAARGQGAELAAGFVLPDTIREAVTELVNRVPDGARPILDAAAVLGRECPLATLQLVCDRPTGELLAAVGEGIAAGVLAAQPRPSSPVRFAHILIREAIYQALPMARRIDLHARAVRALTGQNASGLLAEIAHHAFESAAAGTWLEAAELSARAGQQAVDLFAFDDAAGHFERALIALDHGLSADDARRAELLCKLGVAQIRLGQSRAGRDSCERSAILADRAKRPELFAQAALAFGLELLPGRVDPRLVELLEAALALEPPGAALRAQVMARLAAAMMPTLEPDRPLDLARDAIAAARALGDRRVLAQVLAMARSALARHLGRVVAAPGSSATPARSLAELMGIDRELAGLAEGLGDRLLGIQAHGWMALVAIGLGDADEVKLHISIQRELADALRVPQHEMRAASIRLVWATATGDDEEIARNERLIRELVWRVDDARGLIVLEANRHTRAELRGDFREAHAALDRLELLLAKEEMWHLLRPVWRAATLAREGRLDEARAHLQRFAPAGPAGAMPTIRGVGPALLTKLARIAVRLDDKEWMRGIHDLLLPFAAQISLNAAVPVCDGPVTYYLGLLAAGLGEPERAAGYFNDALERCERAGFIDFAIQTRNALTRPVVAPPRSAPAPRIKRDGELWVIGFDGRQVRLKDSKGMHYLAALLSEPGRELHAGDLIGGGRGGDDPIDVRALGDAGELLDAQARAAYRQRLDRLKDALEDAEERGDREAIGRLKEERAALAGELARAVGLGGRERRAGSAAERARINVQRRIRDVMNKIADVDPALSRYLELHVKTGIFCSFEP